MLLAPPQAVFWSTLRIHTISCSCISTSGWDSSVEYTWDKAFLSVTSVSHCMHGINIWHWFGMHRYPGLKREYWQKEKLYDALWAQASLLSPAAKFHLQLWTMLWLPPCPHSGKAVVRISIFSCSSASVSHSSITLYWVNTAPFHLSLFPLGTNKQKEVLFLMMHNKIMELIVTGCCGDQKYKCFLKGIR